MVAPAVLAAAAKAAKVAKAAKAVAQAKNGSGGGKKNGNKKWLWIAAGVGFLPLAGIGTLVLVLLGSLLGGMGAGAAAAACDDYADNAEAGNTDDAAATNPVMPAGKMYMPSTTARNEIPPKMILASMRAAARYDGLDWTMIAGQMYQETKYGQDPSAAPGGANSLGYMGILQFGKPAWTDYGDDGNGDGKKDLYNIDDAAYAAANFLHAKKAETQPFKALQIYSGSSSSNSIYPRVVLTQSARYRGVLTGDKDLIKRWYAHLAETIEKNPGFPTLGKQSDIPEPVGNGAQPSRALSIAATPARSWSTPPLDDVGDDTTTAMSLAAYSTGTTTLALPAAKPIPGGKDWQWPMKQGTYQMGTPYHKQGNMWSLGYHTGLDLTAPTGTPIYAPADGKVVTAGPGGSYGNMTKLQHAGGVITLYAHQTSIKVSVGQSVKRGDQIGTIGATGNVTGPHLHWEVLVPGVDNPFVGGQDQGPGMVDPAAWMAGRVAANPDYGTVPGDSGSEGRNAQYEECAEDNGGAAVAPDGAGASGVLPDSDDPVIRAVLGWAQRGIGVPYVYGAPRLQGRNPTSFDCSSLTQWAYYMASDGKINIGATTRDQEPRLRKYEVSLSEAQPGDLIFFRPEGGGFSGHVGIVWDPKTKKIIHAPRPGKSVSFSTWDVQDEITGVYRVPIPAGTNAVEGDGKTGTEDA
ncbi:peptidoglycan DD-metalloendopeptidase family protein [Streptomyces sp. NBC_00487]|uniref:peptidoglycan DD-metalloendopeptidase family protein n=1 Tax=unclassified Streptomyces TaxID=2593676 RepID=UPI002E1847D1|nr:MULTISPECIES: peptidoglycan DD-metalloendopeptidase family protein [unclassified Streptomyces]